MERKALLNDKSYYAVIFTSIQSEVNKDYEEMTELIISLAKKQRGFLWVESARSNGIGITVSYLETEKSIRNWKNHGKQEIKIFQIDIENTILSRTDVSLVGIVMVYLM